MNEDISSQEEDADPVEQAIDSAELSILKEKLACNAMVPQGCDPDELNPKNYAYLPSCWTNKIRAAGKVTAKSQSLQGILC